MMNRRWWIAGLVLCLITLPFFAGCGESDEETRIRLEEERRAAEIAQAKELAENLKNNPPKDPEALKEETLKDPNQVTNLEADFRFMYLGEDPDFWYDGTGVTWSDKWTNVYFRDFVGDWAKHRVASRGRNPRWNKSLDDTKVVFENYELRPGEWVGEQKGISVVQVYNPERGTQLITEKPGYNPYFVNEGRNIVYQLDDKFILVDEDLKELEISEDDFLRLVRERYTIDCTWKVTGEFRNVPGLWIHSPDNAYHNQIWTLKELKTYKIAPGTCYIYFVSDDSSGILQLRPTLPKTYTISKGSTAGIQPGQLFDVYERKLSPISGESIGINPTSWRGTIRVSSVEEETAKCERVTRAFRETLTIGDLVTRFDEEEPFSEVVAIE